jgi:hypothetical protein
LQSPPSAGSEEVFNNLKAVKFIKKLNLLESTRSEVLAKTKKTFDIIKDFTREEVERFTSRELKGLGFLLTDEQRS